MTWSRSRLDNDAPAWLISPSVTVRGERLARPSDGQRATHNDFRWGRIAAAIRLAVTGSRTEWSEDVGDPPRVVRPPAPRPSRGNPASIGRHGQTTGERLRGVAIRDDLVTPLSHGPARRMVSPGPFAAVVAWRQHAPRIPALRGFPRTHVERTREGGMTWPPTRW